MQYYFWVRCRGFIFTGTILENYFNKFYYFYRALKLSEKKVLKKIGGD